MIKLRILFIGQNGPYTTTPLHAVIEAHSLVGIVESAARGWKRPSDEPSPHRVRRLVGRARSSIMPRRAPYKSVLQRISENSGVPFFFLTRDGTAALNDFVTALRPDVICVASMSQLLHTTTCALARLGAINLHPSALPKYRGPNPYFWQYYHMDRTGGVTVHVVDPGEDTGDILCQENFPIELGLPFSRLLERVIGIGRHLMVGALDALAGGNSRPLPQPRDTSFPRARNVKRDEPLIDWDGWAIERVWHVMRGTGDWLDAVPTPGGPDSGLRWRVGDMSREKVTAAPGALAKDTNGYFAAHPEGKIRLTLDASSASRLRYYRFVVAGM